MNKVVEFELLRKQFHQIAQNIISPPFCIVCLH